MSPKNPAGVGIRQLAKPVNPENHSCDCAPACPDCGGLSCVCRPRFFAGQCLTEVELNGVMEYVRDRNRQQNRLFGAGVVCGLEVSCDPCGNGSVTVSPGHAISPCGEDIVVCSPASVPVCELINRCRERDQYERDCPPYGPPNAECAQREETWILHIRYAEQVSRPMTALPVSASAGHCGCGGQSSGGCGCGGGAKGSCGCGGGAKGGGAKGGCGCGGHSPSSSGGCGCGDSKSARPSARVPDRCAPPATCAPPRRSRPYQPECEPTVVCETFSFSMSKVEPNHRDEQPAGVPAVASPHIDIDRTAFARCQRDLDRSLPKEPPGSYRAANEQVRRAARAAWSVWCCDVHDALRHILSRHALHDCSLLDRLRAVTCPVPLDPNFPQLMDDAREAFRKITTDLLYSCLCSTLQPPCPESVDDDRVALATIVIRRDPCSVKSICNWDVRSVVLTPRAVMHWLGLTTVPAALRAVVESVCCGERRPVLPREVYAAPFSFPAMLGSVISADVDDAAAMPRLVQALFASKPKLTEQQLADPTGFAVASDVIAPLIRGAGDAWNKGKASTQKAKPVKGGGK